MADSILRVPISSGMMIVSKDIVVFSGGSAANSLVDVFKEIADKRQSTLSYVIPISDNGGSSSELIRVFGGPGIGDIRSQYRYVDDCQAIASSLHERVAEHEALFTHRTGGGL